MRVVLAGPVKAEEGHKLRFHARLRKGQHYAFCEVYSSTNGAQPSPHVALSKIGVLKEGRPVFTPATTLRLTEHYRSKSLELVAEENCDFYIMQDLDTADDPRAKARIRKHGKVEQRALQALRRLVGSARRALRC